jgi:hypothetical protein
MPASDPAAVRTVAVTANNETWQHLDEWEAHEAPGGPPDDQRASALLAGAFTSLWAWSQVGGPAERGRAHHLVSRCAATVRLAGLAEQHARAYHALLVAQPAAFEPFDEALAAEATARALACGGRDDEARALRERALLLGLALTDPDDQSVVLEQIESGPWFGAR